VDKLDNQNKNQNTGEISRILMEKAKKGFEFGKLGNQNQKDVVHSEQPKSNNTGIDRGRWAE
jgi:hypothetical protein